MKFNEVQLGVAFGLAAVVTGIVMDVVAMVQGGGSFNLGGMLQPALMEFVRNFVMGYALGFSYNRLIKGKK